MSLYDLIVRTNAILKKYEKYDVADVKKDQKNGSDPWSQEIEAIEAQIEYLLKQAEEIKEEKNRAIVAARNAAIRKEKETIFRDNFEALRKKIKKGKVSSEELKKRQEQVSQLTEKINAIPDGAGGGKRPTLLGGLLKGTRFAPLNIDASAVASTSEHHYTSTEETKAFESEANQAFQRWDDKLTRIGQGVDELREIAKGFDEELEKQNPTLNQIDLQMDRNIGQLKTNNQKLQGVMEKMRSARNFCCDIILVALLLGIGAYIYSLLR